MSEQQSLFFNEDYEAENVERKSCSDGRLPDNLWEELTAFSNADGGVIYLGLDSDNNFIGLNSQQMDKLQMDLNSLCSSAFNHRIYPDIITHDGAVKVRVPSAPPSLRPIYSKSRGLPQGARVRVGSSNVQLDDHWIRRFALEAEGGAELQESNEGADNILDSEKIARYIGVVNEKRGGTLTTLGTTEVLKKLRVVNKNDKVTLFGLLAFSKESSLQDIFGPTINVAVTQYRGTDKVEGATIGRPFLDNREFYSDALTQFQEAFKFILSKVPIKGVIGPGGIRKDYLVVPDVAIRETLANAIVHRDYTDTSGRVQVDIYADRIEFSNPGTSLVPLSDIENAPPRTRNPLLVNFLKDYGVTEQRARGIRAIKTSLREAGLKEPVFEHRHNSFFATIYSSAFITNEDQQWLSQFEEFSLTENQLKVIVHLKHDNTGISNSEYRNLNNMNNVGDDIKAKKELAKLVESGIFSKQGSRRYTKYSLSDIFL